MPVSCYSMTDFGSKTTDRAKEIISTIPLFDSSQSNKRQP